ncbi:MAG TPA: nitroreductase family protein [Thermotogota bacterium]|nr:nitroreductase family protein [Thermotogota bacterium]HPJ89082.1 nitroreductase family protein [Thermotogota bacterium]HPR96109.1 nitroreductase family protein [Thermotogota bacterium]
MKITEAITMRRTIRKYKQHEIPEEILKNLVNAARLAPSAMNKQPLEYAIITDPVLRERIFENVGWAGYIAPRGNPQKGERPVAYILILIRKELKSAYTSHDIGAAAQNLMLQAMEYDIGSCWLGSLNRQKVAEILNVPEVYEVDTLIALGYKDEAAEYFDTDETVKYDKVDEKYRVPKRRLESIIHMNKFSS